jgi:twinkle protein
MSLGIEAKRYTWGDFGIEINSSAVGETATTCPRCSPHRKKSRDKCLSVNTSKEQWKCWHCKWSGGLEYGEKGQSLPKVVKMPAKIVKIGNSLSIKHQEYLTNDRGISSEVICRHKIFSEGQSICFPFFKHQIAVNYKKRPEKRGDFGKMRFGVSGGEITWYGIDDLIGGKDKPIVICEGEIDKLSLDTIGGYDSVSVPNGSKSKLDILDQIKDRLKDVIICVDSDAAGDELANELVRRIGKSHCSKVSYPADCKDINEVLVKHGPEIAKQVINAAKPYPVEGIYDIEDVEDEIWSDYEHGHNRGLPTNISKALDYHYRVLTGHWTLITGVPSSGKSQFLNMIVYQMQKQHGWKIGICSPETQPCHLHYEELIQLHAGKPFNKPTKAGDPPQMPAEDVADGIDWFKDNFKMVLPRRGGEQKLSIDAILEEFGVLARKGYKGFVLDPYNEVSVDGRIGQNDYEYISVFLTKIRRFCIEHDVHIWVVAHPKKMEKNASGQYEICRPYDIAGAHYWWDKGDCIISIWRELPTSKTNEVDVHIQKAKPKPVGLQGLVRLCYDIPSGRYFDLQEAREK